MKSVCARACACTCVCLCVCGGCSQCGRILIQKYVKRLTVAQTHFSRSHDHPPPHPRPTAPPPSNPSAPPTPIFIALPLVLHICKVFFSTSLFVLPPAHPLCWHSHITVIAPCIPACSSDQPANAAAAAAAAAALESKPCTVSPLLLLLLLVTRRRALLRTCRSSLSVAALLLLFIWAARPL